MKKLLKTLFQYLTVIVLSLTIALLLRLFVVDFYSIPSDSMAPTIEPGDFIMVNKLSFGARMYKNFDFLKNQTDPLRGVRLDERIPRTGFPSDGDGTLSDRKRHGDGHARRVG